MLMEIFFSSGSNALLFNTHMCKRTLCGCRVFYLGMDTGSVGRAGQNDFISIRAILPLSLPVFCTVGQAAMLPIICSVFIWHYLVDLTSISSTFLFDFTATCLMTLHG